MWYRIKNLAKLDSRTKFTQFTTEMSFTALLYNSYRPLLVFSGRCVWFSGRCVWLWHTLLQLFPENWKMSEMIMRTVKVNCG